MSDLARYLDMDVTPRDATCDGEPRCEFCDGRCIFRIVRRRCKP